MSQYIVGFGHQVIATQMDVNETGAGYFDVLNQAVVADIDQLDDFLCQFARIGLQLLGDCHHPIGLVITKFRLRSGDDIGIAIGDTGGLGQATA